jgi:hypothetical protein
VHGDLNRAHMAGRTVNTFTIDELRFMTGEGVATGVLWRLDGGLFALDSVEG